MVCDSVVVMFSSHFITQMIILLLFLFKAKQYVVFFEKFVSLLYYVFDTYTLIKLVCFDTKCMYRFVFVFTSCTSCL